MDPNATLREIRALIEAHDVVPLDECDVDRLTDLVAALDQWMVRGGAKPHQWQVVPRVAQ